MTWIRPVCGWHCVVVKLPSCQCHSSVCLVIGPYFGIQKLHWRPLRNGSKQDTFVSLHSKLRCPIKNQSHINPNGSQWLRHFNPLRLEGDLHLLSHQASFIHCLAVEGLRHRMLGLIFLTSVLLEAELKLAQISSNSSNSSSLHVSVRASGRPRIPTSSGMSLTFSSPTNPRIPGEDLFVEIRAGPPGVGWNPPPFSGPGSPVLAKTSETHTYRHLPMYRLYSDVWHWLDVGDYGNKHEEQMQWHFNAFANSGKQAGWWSRLRAERTSLSAAQCLPIMVWTKQIRTEHICGTYRKQTKDTCMTSALHLYVLTRIIWLGCSEDMHFQLRCSSLCIKPTVPPPFSFPGISPAPGVEATLHQVHKITSLDLKLRLTREKLDYVWHTRK